MAKNNNLTDFLTDVADAIREKKGTSEKINPQNFSSEIRGIESGGGSVDSVNFSYTLYDDTWIGPKNYKTINVKEGVTVLKNLCFYNNTMVLSYTLPSTLKIIEGAAFQNNFELQNVVIPENVQQLLDSSFIGCRTLPSINIPKSVTKIINAFRLCSSLSNITVDSENTVYDSRDNCNAIIETTTNRIIDGGISTVIPKSVVTIGRYSFSGRGPEIFKIPKNIQTIEVSAFDGNNITLEYNFSEHESIPTLVSDNAFKSITVDYKIVVPDSIYDQWITATNWSSLASRIVKAGDQYIDFADPVVAQICAENWGDGTGITYNQAKAVNNISITFKNNAEITSFNELQYFTGINMIEYGAFSKCYNLTNIIIPPNTVTIDVFAFNVCENLTKVIINDKVTTIRSSVFYNCGKLETVICHAPNPPVLEGSVFAGTKSTLTIYVPDESVEAYKGATNWSAYADQIKPISEYVEQ